MTRLIMSGGAGGIGAELAKSLYTFEGVDQIVMLYRKSVPVEVDDARVSLVKCDLRDAEDVKRVIAQIGTAEHNIGIHCAADVSWNKKLEDIYGTNVTGSLNFAELVTATGKRNSMVYLSTAFTDTENWDYKNTYEESKAIAERKLRETFPDLPLWVFAFSLVVGRSDNGEISKFHGLYPLLKNMFIYDVPFVVGTEDRFADIVPIDWLVDEFEHLVRKIINGEGGKGYKVVAAAGENKMTIGELFHRMNDATNNYRGEYGYSPRDYPVFISSRRWNFLRRSSKAWDVEDTSPGKIFDLMDFIDIYKNYLDLDEVLPPSNVSSPAPHLGDYMDTIIAYWFRRNGEYILGRWDKERKRKRELEEKKKEEVETV
ncbi:MAG: SDR family oxidoreductase [Desulfobacter sp.]